MSDQSVLNLRREVVRPATVRQGQNDRNIWFGLIGLYSLISLWYEVIFIR